MKRLLVIYAAIFSFLFSASSFLMVHTVSELLLAIAHLPLLIHFILTLTSKQSSSPHKAIKKIPSPPKLTTSSSTYIPTFPKLIKPVTPGQLTKPQTLIKPVVAEDPIGVDVDRRKFIKLIGSAGISVFMLSIFTKKAQAAFFGSVPGPGTVQLKDPETGQPISPAIRTPTDGYKINNIDSADPSYYGFSNKDGAWFIMREASDGTIRYTQGASGYTTNWTNRAALSYDTFDAVF